MSGRSDLVDLDVVVLRETDLAWGIENPDYDPRVHRDRLIWLPKSQCEIDGGEPPTKAATLTCPSWLAEEKGLI